MYKPMLHVCMGAIAEATPGGCRDCLQAQVYHECLHTQTRVAIAPAFWILTSFEVQVNESAHACCLIPAITEQLFL